MLITTATLSALRTGIQTVFNKAYGVAQTDYCSQLATEVKSDSSSEYYVLMETLFKLREWVGPRFDLNLVERGSSLTNKPYEAMFSIKTSDVEDDRLGSYQTAIASLASAAKSWADTLLVDAINAGTTSLCYDGQYYFDTDHPLEVQGKAATTQANYVSTGCALTAANYAAQAILMGGMLGADGKPLGVTPTHLVVPNALKFTALRIVNADLAGYLANSSSVASDSNIYKGTAQVLVMPELDATSTAAWYLCDLSKPVKPFIKQIRREPSTIVIRNRPEDDCVFDDNRIKVGVDGRGAVGYGLWQLSRKCVA